jgi:hypothetical protein
LPDQCPFTVTDDGFLYGRTGVDCLESYFIIAEGNTDIGEALSKQVALLKQERNELILAGRSQRKVADLRQNIIEQERRQHWFEKAGLYAIMLFGLGAAAL